MTLSELMTKLSDVKQKADHLQIDPEVRVRVGIDMLEADVTLTFTSIRRQGTTFYDQVPCVLFEQKKDEESGG